MTIQHQIDELTSDIRDRDGYWVERAKYDFIEEIGHGLQSNGLNKRQFAEKLGTSPAYITKILGGDTNFTLSSMVKIARRLGKQLQVKLVEEESFASYTHLAATVQQAVRSGAGQLTIRPSVWGNQVLPVAPANDERYVRETYG